MGSIYKITNTRNSKAYIGQTNRNIEERVLREHLAGKGKGSRLVKRAVKKYGKDAFAYEILHDGIIPEFLDDLEIEAIEKFNTIVPYGYNLTTGGEGGFHSVEACRKMSESRKGKKLSQSHRRNISEGSKGRVCSEKTRRKLSEANAGKKHSDETLRKLKDKKVSEETRRKMAEAKKGKKHSEETKQRMSEVHKGKNRHPEYSNAHDFYLSLPSEMELLEKRQRLREYLPIISRSTIWAWTKQWHSESPVHCPLSIKNSAVSATVNKKRVAKAVQCQKTSTRIGVHCQIESKRDTFSVIGCSIR